MTQTEILIKFGEVARFEDGKGLLIPAMTENAEFQELRKQTLVGLTDNPRKQEPHITLMHPRNSTCTDTIFGQIQKINFPTKLEFKELPLLNKMMVDNGKFYRNLSWQTEYKKTSAKETPATTTRLLYPKLILDTRCWPPRLH